MTKFRTIDYLGAQMEVKEFENYFVSQALRSGLDVISHSVSHVRMAGSKWSFLKYYVRTMRVSVKNGQKLSNELKRICDVLFWR